MEFTRRSKYVRLLRSADIGSRSHCAVGHFLDLAVFRKQTLIESV